MFAWAVQRGSSALNMSGALEINRLVVLPLVTVLVLLTNAPDVWYLRTPLVVLSVLALVYETWRSSAGLWFIMAALLGGTIYLNWESNDNHKYLIAYWCLTLCAVFTVGTRHQEATLERSCRSMIGLCMLLAAVWKGATPDYLSGSFFTYELLADERFAQFTDLWGGVPLTTLGEHRELRDLMLHGYERGIELATASFQTSERVRPLALFLTWWTLLIEGALAILFLWPESPR